MNQPINILKKYWGYDSFRESQQEIIESVLSKKDTLALLPTGGGKSLCYQIPALVTDGTCLVISPLISLMKDQIENLNSKGIKAITFQSNIHFETMIALFDSIKSGNAKFLYISPERLQSDIVIEKLKEININFIAIDEAHCISEWGHDFRPSYRKIKNIRSVLPNTTMIAVTATATKKVIQDIQENLDMVDAAIFKKSFYRENIAYQIFTKENKLQVLEQILYKNKSPIIVYVNSRKKTEELARFLNTKGFKATSYHGGMSVENKLSSFNSWVKEENPIVIATNAFGMGIDKPNVKVVVHMDLPNSIESYVQEAGRAGRDGKKSFSVMLQNENDLHVYKKNTFDEIPTISEIKEIHKNLYNYFQVAKGEKLEDTFEFNFQEFCSRYKLRSKKTSNTLRILKNNAIIDLNDSFHQKSSVQFIINNKQLQKLKSKNKNTTELIELMLRNYGGIFQKETSINEFVMAKRLSITSKKVRKLLNELHQRKILIYNQSLENQKLRFLVPREDDKTINRISKNIQSHINQKKAKVEQLISFVKNNQICRSQQLLNYFDESSSENCGICDVCINNKKNKIIDVSDEIIEKLKKYSKLSQTEIIHSIKANEQTVLLHLRNLLSEGVLGLTKDNKLFLK